MPALSQSLPSTWRTDLRGILARDASASKVQSLRSLLLRSTAFQLSNQGIQIPLRLRPAFLALNVVVLLLLALLGFHPRGGEWLPINDKLLHFVCFFFATALFYMIFDVEEEARRAWIWRNSALLLSWVVCFAAGGIGSEFVQSMLPYKAFSWGDVLANLLGSSLGLFVSYHTERRYRTKREIARLYQPLDAQDYNDGDSEGAAEDEEAGAAWGGASGQQGVQGATSPQDKSKTSVKRVRFGNLWDTDAEAQEASLSPTYQAASGSTSKPTSQELFSIDDDEDEDASALPSASFSQENGQNAPEADAWRNDQ